MSRGFSINPYLSLVSARFKTSIQYRTAALAGVVTQIFFGFVLVMVMEAFYASGNKNLTMSLKDVINYIWLGQAFLAMLPWNVDRDIQATIRNGNVLYDFLRPLDLYFIWFSNSLAWRVSATILRAVPLLLFVMLVNPLIGLEHLRLTGPETLHSFIAFLLTYSLTIILSIAITVFMNIITLLFLSADGLNVFITALVTLLSGMIIPLPLFPDWLQPFLFIQPFSALVDFPFRYYTGNLKLTDLIFTLPHQVFWIVFFVIFSRWILTGVKKKLIIQGG